MPLIPHLIPNVESPPTVIVPSGDISTFFTYDVAIGGLGFSLANDPNAPLIYQTSPYTAQRIDQAAEPGEQTLTNWWLKNQSSFHGGAGSLQMERVDVQPAISHIRFDASKNVDCLSVPGKVTRLPDTTTVTSSTSTSMVGCTGTGGTVEYLAFVDQANAGQRLTPSGPTVTAFTGIGENVYAVTSDGINVYFAGATGVWKSVAATPGTAAVKLYSYAADTAPTIDYVKSRLMLATNGTIYELNVNATPTIALTTASTEARFTHPVTGWVWRAFGESTGSILAAGDAFGQSQITQFTIQSGTVPVLQVFGTIATLPVGERILSLRSAMGSFLAIGTTRGIRLGTFSAYSYQAFTYGPLTLPLTEKQFPVAGIATRDRFVFAAGYAYDEPGLLRVDTATQVDQSGRYAYATDLIAPTAPPDPSKICTAVATLPISGSLIFSIPGVGLCLEGTGPGSVRQAWLRTSRIRYGTVEPKLFKLCQVRGDVSSGNIKITPSANDATGNTVEVGFTTGDPDEVGLIDGRHEWIQLTLELIGSSVVLSSWQVKALPGTKRQREIQVVVSIANHETDRRGRRHHGNARQRLEALFALDQAGDVVEYQEWTGFAPATHLVVIESVEFQETGRPTKVSPLAGIAKITMRTVDS